jgi:hypothetical protein
MGQSVKIIGVALKLPDDTIFSLPQPARHHNLLNILREENETLPIKINLNKVEQGFITDTGDFITREEAEIIAIETGQLRRGYILGSVLTSEDLW